MRLSPRLLVRAIIEIILMETPLQNEPELVSLVAGRSEGDDGLGFLNGFISTSLARQQDLFIFITINKQRPVPMVSSEFALQGLRLLLTNPIAAGG